MAAEKKLNADKTETFIVAEQLVPGIRNDFGSGLAIGRTLQFRAVPLHRPRTRAQPWRVLLVPDNVELPSIALDVWGDVEFGRGDQSDVDLTGYGGVNGGVSRRHAMLRPTGTALFLIDLDSSNGTHLNGVPVGSGTALKLSHDDTVAFGNLHFTLDIVYEPIQTAPAGSS